ncbi:TetR/AcrR family transcriptional regulator [Agrobacterium tumefaciens]|uniref:TetR family transcriptional regulator n=1 Tax=Agrobacterium tumefaciens TaxID=358 RepID=UPI001572C68C|nr:TetR family transcriptional regulator [Agrobacterium tumefaciens]NSZ01337.1 TetR/AcrR family transcriptional regulator [Agrobacterium tumefaciens]NSZ36486.1 TetR/AcrR family transcriptional regulator [Agrobacterium tumefaciens]NTB24164.1 TetR/AcrR family transcriptional regulator [Agrobacterium tumefaciens]NTB31219.1 TetR/AcrR family transcriptional regulator [Agrobacterium tumefaciens]NTB34959.1 TetR/AcrR family transcriptional regulator [Agrobacterium tumefaciens]
MTKTVTSKGTAETRPAKRDPEGVRRDILSVAMEEFSQNGLSGARIDEIAARTRTSKRMIYYYFTDKESLYQRVLEEAYAKVRGGESDLGLDDLEPVAALEKLCRFTFDHHRRNPAFIRMVMIENIHHGRHMQSSGTIRELNRTAIEALESVLVRGQQSGIFRQGIDALELHWQISALSFFNVSNVATFSFIFGDSLFTDEGQETLSQHASDMVLRYVLAPAHLTKIVKDA